MCWPIISPPSYFTLTPPPALAQTLTVLAGCTALSKLTIAQCYTSPITSQSCAPSSAYTLTHTSHTPYKHSHTHTHSHTPHTLLTYSLHAPLLPCTHRRMYGALTGLSKQMVAQRHGTETLKKWRRGYATRPPPISSFSSIYPGEQGETAHYYGSDRSEMSTYLHFVRVFLYRPHPSYFFLFFLFLPSFCLPLLISPHLYCPWFLFSFLSSMIFDVWFF